MQNMFSNRLRAASLALAFATAPAAHAQIAIPTFTVMNSEELGMMLSVIRSDAVVLLEPGVYADVTLLNIKSGYNITIRSQLANNRATLGRVVVRGSSRIRFDQVNFQGPRRAGESDTVSTVTVRESDMIHFTNCNFSGSMNGDINDDGILLRFMASSNAIVLNSVFREARVAISTGDGTNMSFVGNNIADVREGINIFATWEVNVDRNHFSNIFPNTVEGDHSDAIQIFTGIGTRNTKGVLITNNAMMLGNSSSQGLFIRNETGIESFNPVSVAITNNLYFGRVRHAMTASNVKGLTMRQNTAVPAPGVIFVPGITANDSVTVLIERSITPLILSNVAWTGTRNTILTTSKSTGVDIASQFIGPVNIEKPAISSFRVAAGSESALATSGFTPVSDIGGMSIASATTRYRTLQSRLTPIDGAGDIPEF